MARKIARYGCLLGLALWVFAGCAAPTPAPGQVVDPGIQQPTEVVIPPPATQVVIPASADEESIRKTIFYANERYAAAFEVLDRGLLADSWHGDARQEWEDGVARYESQNSFRVSTRADIEVTTVYFHNEQSAIAKTIEFWDFEERDRSTDEVKGTNSLGPLHETYNLEIVDGHWSIGSFALSREPSLTLTEINGEVFLRGERVSEDQEVFQGDEIITGSGASALLLYPFNSTTEIREDGHLILAGLEVNPDPGAPIRGQVEYELVGTSVWNRIEKVWRSIFRGGGATAIDQPAVFGVTLEENGNFIVEVEAGDVELTSEGVTVQVNAGQQSFASPGLPPIEPVPWPGPLLVQGIDLVITALEVVGEPRLNDSGRIELPLRVGVSNQGDTEAGTFTVGLTYTSPRGTFMAPFQLTGGDPSQGAVTPENLPPGGDAVLEGVVLLPEDMAGQTVQITALADSCEGVEFAPEYCRVDESNEENNSRTIESEILLVE